MKVLVFQGYVDPRERTPEALLQAWPTLPGMVGALVRAGADVTVVVAGRHHRRLERDGATYHFVREAWSRGPRRVLGHRAAPHPRRSLDLARALPADVVHLHGLSFPLQARALTRGRPPVLAQDHADAPPGGWRRPVHAWGLRRLAGVAFTHPALALPFQDAGILPAGLPVFQVPEGSSTFTPAPRDQARALTGMEGAPGVLAVGNLAAGKDPSTVLDAVAAAAARLPGLRLWMVYRGGEMEAALRDRVAADAVLRDRVRFVGAVPHEAMEAWHRSADVLVSASRREGSGYAVIEALACGTPVVATAIPAHRALVGEQAEGALALPGDAAGLARGIVAAWEGGAQERAAARRRFEEALSWPAVARSLMEAYRSVGARP